MSKKENTIPRDLTYMRACEGLVIEDRDLVGVNKCDVILMERMNDKGMNECYDMADEKAGPRKPVCDIHVYLF
jgi:hypothetical protein